MMKAIPETAKSKTVFAPAVTTRTPGRMPPAQSSDARHPNTACVGESLEFKGVKIYLDAVKSYTGASGYPRTKPSEDKEIVMLWFTVDNASPEDLRIHTYYGDSYCDGFAVKTKGAVSGADGSALWGIVATGKKSTGYVAYEVPTDWSEIEFQYKPTISGNQEVKMIFIANQSDITS